MVQFLAGHISLESLPCLVNVPPHRSDRGDNTVEVDERRALEELIFVMDCFVGDKDTSLPNRNETESNEARRFLLFVVGVIIMLLLSGSISSNDFDFDGIT